MRIWVTRTEPAAAGTAERLRAIGLEPVIAPVLEVRPLSGADLDLSRAGALALTSRNAVPILCAGADRRDLPVFAVGEATALAAREAGFSDVVSADGDAADLVELIARRKPSGEVVWAAPAEPAADLVALLSGRGVTARRVPVYETVETGAAPPEGIGAVLIHSPRAAGAVARTLDPEAARGLLLYAISAAAAAPLAALPFARVAVSPRPNETALLSLIAG